VEVENIPISVLEIEGQGESGFDLDEPIITVSTFVLAEGRQELARFVGYSGIEDFFVKLAHAAEGHL
jgi:hypothetical protein